MLLFKGFHGIIGAELTNPVGKLDLVLLHGTVYSKCSQNVVVMPKSLNFSVIL